MSIRTLSPRAAQDLIAAGAVLVDVRGADEHARERIAQARHVPLGHLTSGSAGFGADVGPVIFHCRSGQRTNAHAQALASSADGEAYLLEGGLDAWKAAGLPVVRDASRPLELMRQVQITAGSLVVAGVVLGATVSPWFHALSGFVGAGLVFAGASGWCGMARLLMFMPWNRRAA